MNEGVSSVCAEAAPEGPYVYHMFGRWDASDKGGWKCVHMDGGDCGCGFPGGGS